MYATCDFQEVESQWGWHASTRCLYDYIDWYRNRTSIGGMATAIVSITVSVTVIRLVECGGIVPDACEIVSQAPPSVVTADACQTSVPPPGFVIVIVCVSGTV